MKQGFERRGAPVTASIGVDDKPRGDIHLIYEPDCAVLLICGMGTQTFCGVPTHMTIMTNLPSTASGLKRHYKKIGKDVKVVCFAAVATARKAERGQVCARLALRGTSGQGEGKKGR